MSKCNETINFMGQDIWVTLWIKMGKFQGHLCCGCEKKVSYLLQAMALVFCHLTPYALPKVIHTTDLQMKYTTAGINSKSSNAAHTAPLPLPASTLGPEKVCTGCCSCTKLYL